MKLELNRDEEEPRLMIIPMIDIIFFLLVFFMMSMLSMVEQKTMPLALPSAQSSELSTVRNVPVTVTKDGQVYYEKDAVGLVELDLRLQKARSASESGEVSVILRGDQGASYGDIVQVMDIVKKAGVSKISIATEQQG